MQIRATGQATSGSGANLSLHPAEGFTATVPVARALVRRGVRPSVAKAVVERLAAGQAAAVSVKHYDQQALDAELSDLKVGLDLQASDPKTLAAQLTEVRKARQMSQDQFANHAGLKVSTLRNWEQARFKLDQPTALLIRMVIADPDLAFAVAAGSVPGDPGG